ncbi:hypothetical protein D0C36_08050 [Mucilaginibacter conchicola]|uniref:Uncharacterized protein n=1 Tax=Mucilaginibacter conchicola TaxID=2303333 RepID=A0A372NZD2_9SPHI|nr:hypothetical protein [Mucilaginibacter conchicola]RFZ95463.1 hypothetical protein D0C36_08050 [Mucilaginibacter conchicola]
MNGAMPAYFGLQYKRLLRSIKDFGMNPYLGMVLAALLFFWLSKTLFSRIAYFQYYYAAAALFMVLQLSETRRNDFLKNIYTKTNYARLRLLENLLLVFPFVIFLVVRGFYICATGAITGSLICSFYNKFSRSAFVIPSPFSKQPFEFTTGFRKYYPAFIVIYAVTAIAVVVGNFYLGAFLDLLCWLVCMNFYSTTEPSYYVWIHAQSPKEFLTGKIKTALRYSFISSLPLAIVLCACFPAKAWVVAVICFCGLLYMTAGVLLKYTGYPKQISLPATIIAGIGIIIPPLLLFVIPFFYNRAIQKLTSTLK